MRGYFGIGAENISKAMNVAALMRTAHAFGASFVFSIGAVRAGHQWGRVDTSDTTGSLPYYGFDDAAALLLPNGGELVGIEITDDASPLPSFHHPRRAAYVLGRERGSLSEGLLARCDHVVRIPSRFSINLAIAGAMVMYDRMLCMGLFAPRPHRPGAPAEPVQMPAYGEPLWVRKDRKRARATAAARAEL